MGGAARARATRALAQAIRERYPRVSPQTAYDIAHNTVQHRGYHSVWCEAKRRTPADRARLVVVAWARHHGTDYDDVMELERGGSGRRAPKGAARRATLAQTIRTLDAIGVGGDAVFGPGDGRDYAGGAGEGTRARGKARSHLRQRVQAGGAAGL